MKPRIRLVPLGDAEMLQRILLLRESQSLTLAAFLARAPALAMEEVKPEWLDLPLSGLRLVRMDEVSADVPLYRPPGLQVGAAAPDTAPAPAPVAAAEQSIASPAPDSEAEETTARSVPRPGKPTEEQAVHIAYAYEIKEIASFLGTGIGLSVLVYCDKIAVQHFWRPIVRKAGREPRVLEVPDEGRGGGLIPQSLQQRQLARLKQEMAALKEGQVLVIPHLDLLAGSAEGNLSNEARELTELLYTYPDRLILAFADRSLTVPEVLAARFAVRRLITGVPRKVVDLDGSERLLGDVFVAPEEAAHFKGFDAGGLYKNVAGMNPIQVLHALSYAVREFAGSEPVPVDRLYRAIRAFKVQSSASFEVPDVSFEQIGGYGEVKAQLAKAIGLMAGGYRLPDERLRRELIPRGFIFYGPPGTGKTLFAKAIANKLNATVQVVSGPEVTDMYVGESERKVRELFAEARRNAPSVLVFDEFDAIAAKRSGREDGGSRAGNAIVAQMLTEMDGFRPDVPMLIIGTTNRIELIDEALLRPSRFQAVAIGLPDTEARRAIAEVHAGWFQVRELIADGLLDLIAESTEGFNGDEIRSLFRDACVGRHCEDPPLAVDARRLGELVGALRKNTERRQIATGAHDRAPATRRGSPASAGSPFAADADEPAIPL